MQVVYPRNEDDKDEYKDPYMIGKLVAQVQLITWSNDIFSQKLN